MTPNLDPKAAHGTVPAVPGHPCRRRSGVDRALRWLALASLLWAAVLRPEAATAQVIVVSSASIFEGNAGTQILKLPVSFVGPQPATVTGTVSAVPLSGNGFVPATSGTACGAGVDFVGFTNVPFSIPPNTPNGTLTVNITVCGDSVIEPDENIFVSLTVFSGAECTGDSCGAVGTIRDDDGAPRISINNISTSEPVFGVKNTAFTVSLSHVSPLATSVNFRTRDGTARAPCVDCNPPVVIPDYNIATGTLLIPPNALSGTISVGIRGDGVRETNETFFVDLSAPVNATIADSTGQATIIDTTLMVGGFDLSPADADARIGETVSYTLDWTVPDNLVWRNLKSLDFRLRDQHRTALWLRWDEASNLIRLCSKVAGDDDDADDDSGGALARAGQRRQVVCGPGELPGTGTVLMTPFALVQMAGTSVVGSGPTGAKVTLTLALSMLARSADHSYRVELAAADDFGNEDSFVRAGSLHVQAPAPHPR